MLEKKLPIHSGGCLCGAVRYEVEGPPLVVAHCHCNDCQRGSGTGHSTGAMFPADTMRLTGPVTEFTVKSDNGNQVTRVFCPACGSPVLGRNSGMEGYLTIALGTLDDSSGFEPQVVVFARSRKPWDIMDESLPTFDAQPNWKPGDAV
jgi:hypothetical protein